jgi:rhodanese-related sulfurtransferase
MKKMLLMTITMLMLTGCGLLSKDFVAYDDTNYQGYIDRLSEALQEKIKPSVYIDLRPLGNENNAQGTDYANGHIEFFLNYDYKAIGDEEFLNIMKTYYSKKHHIFLLDADGTLASQAANLLKENGYRHLYFYTKGYLSLMDLAQGQLRTATGECGC